RDPDSRTPAVAPEGWWSRLKPLLQGATRGLRSAGGVHQHQLGILDRGDAEAVLAADRGAVARLQGHAVHLHPAAVGDQVAVAARPGERVLRAFAGLERGAEHARIRADRQRVVVALDAAGQGHEPARAPVLRERPRAPRRRLALAVGEDPDLEDPGHARLEVVLGVADAGARAHHLHVAGHGAALVAQAVLVGDRPLAHVGDDLHVGVRVRREAGARLDGVVVPHPQRAPVDAVRVVVTGEREVVLRVEPAV